MGYIKQSWKDRVVQFAMRFRDQHNNELDLTPDPGAVGEAGTPVDADHLNHMEDGIYTAQATAEAAQTAAAAAQTKANSADGKANTADGKADAAQSTANTANGKADTAITKADNAQGTANTAKNTAEAAQNRANAALPAANYTTDDVFSKVLAKDGPDSGLTADYVHSQPGNQLLNLGQTKKLLAPGTDISSCQAPGSYCAAPDSVVITMANRPCDSSFHLIVDCTLNTHTYVTQIAVTFTARLFIRAGNSDQGWLPWREL